MPHQTPNPHDAEEQLRPVLGLVFETNDALAEARRGTDGTEWLGAALTHVTALETALAESLQLLGVQQ
jgi:hypothetical protein